MPASPAFGELAKLSETDWTAPMDWLYTFKGPTETVSTASVPVTKPEPYGI